MSKDPKSSYYDYGGIETIDFIRSKLSGVQMDAFEAYCLGNAMKYASRLPHKGVPERDAEKLANYSRWLNEARDPQLELTPTEVPPAEEQVSTGAAVPEDCEAQQHGDLMLCSWCGTSWNLDDPHPATCKAAKS